MPSTSLKKYLEDIIESRGEKFEDNFDIEWNLFSTLCLIRSEKCLDRKSDREKFEFRNFFMKKCKSKTEKINFFLKDKHFEEDLDDLFQNLIKDSGLSKESKKSSAIARYFCDSAKRKEDPEKALEKYNMALMYCPYSTDATNPSDTLLYAKILLKRSELTCLNLKAEDALRDIYEGLKLLKELKGEERNLIYCKFLYAKSVYLDLMDYREYEQKKCSSLIEKTIDEFKFNSFLCDKLNKYYEFLCNVFTTNKELIKSELRNRQHQPIKVNELKANSKLPGGSSSIELCLIEGKGRCTRACQSIKDGSILFVEKPIVQWLRPTMYKNYCNHCFVKIDSHFMTCFKCIKIKYCSSECRDQAWQNYHSMECKFLECLRYLGYGHMVLRTILLFDQDQMMSFLVDKKADQEIDEQTINDKVCTDYTDASDDARLVREKPKSVSLESLINCDRTLSLRSKIENIQFEDNNYWIKNGFPSETSYGAFFSLFGDEKHLNYFQLVSFCYGVSLMGRLAEKMKIIDKDDRFYYIFHTALLNHILKINFNCYSINDHTLKLDTKYNFWTHSPEFSKIGIGVYLSSSIISHSCDYNSNKLSIGSKIIVYANQNIAKGMEINHTYGPSYRVSSYRDRQTMLKNGYLFDCECIACQQKLESIHNAFNCTFCQTGALIWNQDYSNECQKCGVKDQDLNPLINKLTQVQNDFNEATELLTQGKWSECKQKLDYSKKLLKSIFYSDQKLEHLYRLYLDYYFQREKYAKAAKISANLAQLQREKDGKETLESVLYAVKSLSLLARAFERSSNSFPAFNQQALKRSIQKMRENYNTVLDNFNQIISRQVKLVEDSFLPYMDSFEHVENFLQNSSDEN